MIRYYCDLCQQHVKFKQDLHNITIDGLETSQTMFELCDCCYDIIKNAVHKALENIEQLKQLDKIVF
jgi:hypothetical protein